MNVSIIGAGGVIGRQIVITLVQEVKSELLNTKYETNSKS